MLALIMAGGTGTRFWPKSRAKHPKQFLKIHGDRTMIQQTAGRLQSIIPDEHIFVVTTAPQAEELSRQLPFLPQQNVVIEPMGKNTAPCIGLGALFLRRIDPEAVMVVQPADHLILREQAFLDILQEAELIARESGALVTIGVQPTYPATGYGYIQHTEEKVRGKNQTAYVVKTFAEKPNLDTARLFLQSGDFLWNSGIFVWKISSILKEIEEHLPDLAEGLWTIDKAIGTAQQDETISRVYKQIKSISIDYGIMEAARQVLVLPGDFGWNDLGSWNEVYEIGEKDKNGNVADAGHLLCDTSGCLVDVPGKLVATVGVQDLIIVETDDAILICPRERAQDVKNIVDGLKQRKLQNLL